MVEVAWLACVKVDSRSEYLFFTSSVVTTLVTSFRLFRLCRAAVLWWIRIDSVLTPHLSTAYLISTNTTSGCGVVPDTRVSKKLSQEFTGTENRILSALSRLGDFLVNPLTHGYSVSAPETSRSSFGTNQGTNGDDSQSDPHPEAGIFRNQTTRNSGPEDSHDIDSLASIQLRKLLFDTLLFNLHLSTITE